MNQLSPKSSFNLDAATPFDLFSNEKRSSSDRLRQVAAHFQLHHAIVHRLGPQQTKLCDATYATTCRGIDQSEWTIGDLLNADTCNSLRTSNRAVTWQNDVHHQRSNGDPLTRLNIIFGVSVSFHNALGNHVALTLCDSAARNVDCSTLHDMAWPLIDAVLEIERQKSSALCQLSEREADCLQWSAAGKTSLETGIILGLSPHTVNQYLTAATIKLEAVNRTHAVTKAIRLGLIDLSAV